jgi:hypothetical protein
MLGWDWVMLVLVLEEVAQMMLMLALLQRGIDDDLYLDCLSIETRKRRKTAYEKKTSQKKKKAHVHLWVVFVG